MTDEDLVQLARDGDVQAFEQLVARHSNAVYRAALAAVRVPEDAEEVAQDAFVRCWRSLHRFRGDSSFRTWLLTIAWRRALTRRRSVVTWWRRRVNVEPELNVPYTGSDSTGQLSTLELQRAMREAIRALSPKLRDALLLAQSGDYDYVEIGAMLHVREGTVKWRVSEARRKVREQLARAGYRVE